LDDADPDDGLAIGVFTRANPGEFAQFFNDSADVAVIAHGFMRSPNFLGANGVIDPRKITGEVAAEDIVEAVSENTEEPSEERASDESGAEAVRDLAEQV